MKKYLPNFIAVMIVVGVFVFFYAIARLNLTLSLPYFDQVTVPALEAFSVWTTKSVATLSLIGNVLQWLKKKATLSPNNTDDKIITYLVYFFSLQWIKNVSGKNNER